MSKRLRIWLFVLLGTLLTSSSLLAEGVITMTTSQWVGETIKLKIEASGNVTIEGAQETGETDDYGRKSYTIKSQTITIRGDVTTLKCSYNQLTSLNLSGCTALTTLSFQGNQLTSLDVSKNTALTTLDCSLNQLTSLNVSGCTALTKLNCWGNNLTSLDLSGCTALTTLDCKLNQLTSLDVSKNTALTTLYCDNNQLTSLDVSGCSALTKLSCFNNQLTSLEASGCTALTKLDCSNNPLTSINLSGCQSLKEFSYVHKKLTSLDVSGCTALTSLDCYSNQLTSLNVSGCTALRWLSCSNNQLTSLDLSGCTSLTSLRCYNNPLTSINLSGCQSLKEFSYTGRRLTSLDVSSCTALTKLSCSSNRLTSLDVSGCTSLGQLDCSDNPLTSIDLSSCKSLKEFTWNKKKLTSLDVSGCTSLTKLECNENQLTSLKVSGCTALTELGCYGNRLTSLNVSGCTALTELDCSKNQLTSLDVSGCTALTKQVCYKNRLKGEAMTQMVAGLSDRNGKEPGSLYVVCDEADENNLLRPDALTASRKNWRIFKYIVNTGKSVLYSGAGSDDEIVMTITQEQYLEGGIRLAILADGDVTIEGIHERRIFTDGSEHTYTLAGKQITIRGNVTELDCSKNQITNLDVSKNTSLWILRCSDNKLTSLNASGSSLLTEIYCSSNQLTSLDLSGCISLETLECDNNQLTALNISGCARLKTLYCYSNCLNGEAMTKLVNSLPDRKGLSSGTLRVVDANRDKNWCSFADVATASKKNWAVQKYEPYSSSWTSYSGVGEGVITMTTSKAVGEKVELVFEANRDVVIEGVSEMPQLGRNRNNYTLTSQTITIRGDVTTLYCYNNQLTSLDVSGCTSLTNLDCYNNQLTSLNVSGCTSLTNLDCNNNQLSSLDLLQSSALVELVCSRNKLETLDLSVCSNLKSLACYRNKIRGNAVAQLVESLPDRYGKDPGEFYFVYYSEDEYEENFCYRPAVGRANDKNWRPQKRYYGDWKDYFGVIDEGVVMMRTAQKVGSKITLTLEAKEDVAIDGVKGVPETDGKPHQYTLISQDVTIRGYVTKLHCSGNKLTSLDLSTTVPLVELDCSNNQLTALDVSQNAALTSLSCYRNQIKGEAMAQLIKGLPQLPLRSTHLFGIVSNAADERNVFFKADVERVQDKGWSPMKWDEERHQYEPYAGKETETFAVTLKKEGEGTIKAVGADDLNAVPYGTELTIEATPAEGYKLTALTANGTDILATKKVVIKGATEVKATFADNTGVETTVTQQVKLYPNPATDYVIVEGVAPASEVTLHSMTGERLYAGRADGRGTLQIDLSAYADGVYLVCVAGETYRVVVRR